MAGPILHANSPFLNFGTVAVSSTATLSSVMVDYADTYNVGIGWSTVLSGPGAANFTVTFDSGGCSVGNNGLITVRFAPTGVTSYSATLTLTSNANNSPTTIGLSGSGGAGGFLTLTPQTTNDFGMVKDGTTSSVLNVLAENNSGTNVIVTAIAFSAAVGAIGSSAIDVGGTGYAVNDVFTISTGGANAMGTVTGVSGSGVVLSYTLTVPGSGYSIGTGVATTGGSGTGLTISISVVNSGEFAAGPGQPALPFTLLANGASSPVVIPVQFQPVISGFLQDAQAVQVTSNATNSVTYQQMQGTGVIIFPAYIVPLIPQAVLFAFGNTILRMNSLDLNCEEPASFTRIYDWSLPLQDKYLGRVAARYEDNSATTFALTCTVNLTRSPFVVTDTVTGQGGLNDGLIHNMFFDIQQSDDLMQVVMSRLANSGPLVITEIFHEIDPRGDFIPS